MKITYVTKSHTIDDDDTETKDVVAQSIFDAAGAGWNKRLDGHDSWIRDALCRMNRIEGDIKFVWNDAKTYSDDRINALPEIGREVFSQVLEEMLGEKLRSFENQVNVLRNERCQVAKQVSELDKIRTETVAQLAVLRAQLKMSEQLAQAMKSDFSKQLEGLREERTRVANQVAELAKARDEAKNNLYKLSEGQSKASAMLAELRRQREVVAAQLANLQAQQEAMVQSAQAMKADIAKRIEELKEERTNVASQLVEIEKARNEVNIDLQKLAEDQSNASVMLAELQRRREETATQLTGLSRQLETAIQTEQSLKADFNRQTAELRAVVPVPKKFAKFLFVKTEPASKKED